MLVIDQTSDFCFVARKPSGRWRTYELTKIGDENHVLYGTSHYFYALIYLYHLLVGLLPTPRTCLAIYEVTPKIQPTVSQGWNSHYPHAQQLHNMPILFCIAILIS